MNKALVDKFYSLLIEQKSLLLQQDSTSEDSEKPVALDQSSTGRLTRMDAMQAQEMALAAKRRRKKQLVKIDQALIRISESDYGVCLECDEKIALPRLEYNPAAEYCLRCAEKIERSS